MRKINLIGLAVILFLNSSLLFGGNVGSDCTFKGKKLYGKVQFVTSFPDIKVQIVTSFPDVKY